MSSPDFADLARIRTEYAAQGLPDEVPADPLMLFATWFTQVRTAGLSEPNAMELGTIDETGAPASRLVLLKGVEDGTFQFFTNLTSAKARQLTADPRCAVLFPWHPLQRQVRITGVAEPIPRDEVEAYYAQRPRAAQIGAWASHQSQPIGSRTELDAQYAAALDRFGEGTVPCPDFWGGFAITPQTMEFWHGRTNRLHDRIRYQRDAAGWQVQRLQP